MKLRYAWLVVALIPIVAQAQDGSPRRASDPGAAAIPEMVPDRPDFTESATVIPRGALQFESGLHYEGDTASGIDSRAMSTPTALLRIGMGRRSELRVSGDGLLSNSVEHVRTSGYSDVAVGAKFKLFDQRQIGVDLAVLPLVSLPVGTEAFTSGGADPTIKIAWERELPAGFGLSGNINAASISEQGQRFRQHALSASLEHDLFMGYSSFVEVYGLSRMSLDDGNGITINAGLSHPMGENQQFDVEAGHGLSAAAPDWFVGFGFAIRGRLGR
jgi:hypothetical protein